MVAMEIEKGNWYIKKCSPNPHFMNIISYMNYAYTVIKVRTVEYHKNNLVWMRWPMVHKQSESIWPGPPHHVSQGNHYPHKSKLGYKVGKFVTSDTFYAMAIALENNNNNNNNDNNNNKT